MTHDAETTLKPCPFCGGVHLLECKGHSNSYVECRKCGAYGPDGPVGPVEWNTRAALDAMQPTVAEAAKVLLEALHENTQGNWKVVWSAMREDALEMDMPAAFSEALCALAGEDRT